MKGRRGKKMQQRNANQTKAICCNVPGGITQDLTDARVSLVSVMNGKGNKEVKEIC
jgi:hypothetical protein